MPTVKMFYQSVMMKYRVCFCQGNELVGTHWEFSDSTEVIALMRAAECREHDIREAEKALKEYRPGSVDLSLTPEQFTGLKTRKQSQKRP
jgi:hypothetical protein